MAAKAAKPNSPCPRRDDLLAYLRDREEPASLAELARAFNVKGKDRTALRLLLRELEDEGLIEAPARRKYSSRQRLDSVAVWEITGTDAYCELRAPRLRRGRASLRPSRRVAFLSQRFLLG